MYPTNWSWLLIKVKKVGSLPQENQPCGWSEHDDAEMLDGKGLPIYASMATQWGNSRDQASAFPMFHRGVPAAYRYM
jgi:hypothetical protein